MHKCVDEQNSNVYDSYINSATLKLAQEIEMNYCQVEVDTAKYYRQQEQLEAAQEAAEAQAVSEVDDANSNYFWADHDNMLEALTEAETPKHQISKGTYQAQLTALLIAGQYESYGKLCESISKEYWTEYVLDLVD